MNKYSLQTSQIVQELNRQFNCSLFYLFYLDKSVNKLWANICIFFNLKKCGSAKKPVFIISFQVIKQISLNIKHFKYQQICLTKNELPKIDVIGMNLNEPIEQMIKPIVTFKIYILFDQTSWSIYNILIKSNHIFELILMQNMRLTSID